MGRVGLSKVLGRAAMDKKFLNRLSKNPAAAARSIKVKLSPTELASLKQLSLKNLRLFSTDVRKNELAFFDQQQQQQQQSSKRRRIASSSRRRR